MPIVFCASLVPWESENRLPVMIWPEPEAARDGARPQAPDDPVDDAGSRGPAATNASTGATSAGMTTFSSEPVADARRWRPRPRTATPTTPPISACEDEDGSPKYQVSRFQEIAPIRPAKTIGSVTRSASTIPLAIVAATASDRNAPTKLRTAASVTATRGAIARVEIDVATALAVSWKPLVKSNASAVATTIKRTTSFSIAADAVRSS